MQTRDYARAALWDTAITFSPQSRAMTSPDHLDIHSTADDNKIFQVETIVRSRSPEQITDRKKSRASVHILLGRRQSPVENQEQTDQLTYDAGSENRTRQTLVGDER